VTVAAAQVPAAPAGARTTLVMSCAAVFLVMVNYTVPAVTLPVTAADLRAGGTGPAWILNGLVLGLSALLLVAGVIADEYGRRRTYLVGMLLFALASVGAAIASRTATFVTARVLQGAASAALLAAGLGAVGHAYPAGPPRLKATSSYGAMVGLGVLAGPFVAAGITTVAGWRATYGALAVVAAVLALLGAGLLPESRAERPRRLDVAGVVTLSLGLTALVTGLTEGRLGWTRPLVPASFGLAAVLLVAFTLIERHRTEPLLELVLFRTPLFAIATGGALVSGITVMAVMTFLPNVVQLAHGISPIGAALLFGLWSGVSFLVSLQARRVPLAGRSQLGLGLTLAVVGYLPLLGVGDHWSPVRVVIGLLVAGVGSGLINAALAYLAVASVPPGQSGMRAGANNTARYVGSALGVAAISSVVGAYGLSRGIDVALVTCIAVVPVVVLAGLRLRIASEDRSRGSLPRIAPEDVVRAAPQPHARHVHTESA